MPNVTMYTTNGMTTTQDNRWNPADLGQQKLNLSDVGAMVDIQSLDIALATLNGTYWTSKRLNEESIWDKQFWLRSNRRGTASLT